MNNEEFKKALEEVWSKTHLESRGKAGIVIDLQKIFSNKPSAVISYISDSYHESYMLGSMHMYKRPSFIVTKEIKRVAKRFWDLCDNNEEYLNDAVTFIIDNLPFILNERDIVKNHLMYLYKTEVNSDMHFIIHSTRNPDSLIGIKPNNIAANNINANDAECYTCGNDKVNSDETKCWKCGAEL